jgi:hypothetical protein
MAVQIEPRRALGRSFHFDCVQEVGLIRQFRDRAFRLLDTDGIEVEELEDSLLERGRFGAEREAMFGT